MNKLSSSDRSHVLHLLFEGNSVRSTERLTGIGKNAILKLMVETGQVCADYHDAHVVNLKSRRVQVDEIWAFVYAKQKNAPGAIAAPDGAGDAWTWTAIDADSKLMIAYFVGDRDADCAFWFIENLRKRLANRVQLTSDGHKAYLEAVETVFGADVDYAQLIKIFVTLRTKGPEAKYSPGVCTGILKKPIEGSPDPAHISTSFVERHNLTLRMHNRRFTRLTNGFSKKLENHAYSVALFAMYYNFCKIHISLRMTPAMVAGVTRRLWDVSDIVALLEAEESKAITKRGPYKKTGP
jgi:IS1 family transposase